MAEGKRVELNGENWFEGIVGILSYIITGFWFVLMGELWAYYLGQAKNAVPKPGDLFLLQLGESLLYCKSVQGSQVGNRSPGTWSLLVDSEN